MSLVGFAVAGGRSRRMEQDKALLAWGPSDLLHHTLGRLSQVTTDSRILSGPTTRYLDRGVPVHPDVVPDAGPLGGLLTALEEAGDDRALILAVDLPLVPVPLLAHLAERARLWVEADAVVPVSPRGPEPLCAVYGPRCLEPVRGRVAARDFKMTSFWKDARVQEIGSEELSIFGDPDRLFLNVNLSEDYARARAL
jgi:molybdopterin-guanine dinucleotide biosynthesis protein A